MTTRETEPKVDPDPKALANLPDRWERESAGYDVDGNESDGRVRACAAQLRGALAVHERELTAERERRLLAELEVERLRAALGSARKDMVREVSELLRPDSSEAERESANRLARGYERIDKAVLSATQPPLAELRELVRRCRDAGERAFPLDATKAVSELDAERERRLLAELEAGRLREGLEESKRTAHADLAKARMSAKDGCDLCKELALHLARCHAVLTEGSPPPLVELSELVAAAREAWLLLLDLAKPGSETTERLRSAREDTLSAYPFLREGREG